MKDILSQLNAIKKELSSKDNVKPATIFWNKGVSASVIEKIQATLNFEISKDILNVYRIFNGLVIDWEIRLPDEPWRTVTGRSNIPRLEFLFNNEQIIAYKDKKNQLDHYWPDDCDREKIDHYKQFYAIDFLKTGESILIKPAHDSKAAKLFFYIFPDEFTELTINFEEYIYQLLNSKGEYGWQSVFFTPNISNSANIGIFADLNKGTNYFTLINSRVELLRKNNKFTKILFEPNPGVKISTLRRIKKVLNVDLPNQMLLFYYFINGFKLSWVWKDGDIILEGNIDLLPLENVFGGPGGELTKSWNSDVKEGVLWENRNISANPKLATAFEYIKRIESVEGQSREVMVKFTARQDSPDMSISLLEKGAFISMNMDFFIYIKVLIETLGLAGWHQALIDTNAEFVKNLSLVFPNTDFNQLMR